MTEKRGIVKLAHHEQQDVCRTRPAYRQGKKLTAVKVYTINNESQHLLICGVPKLQLTEEVKKLVFPYGDVKKIKIVSDYPTEEFTDVFHVHFARIQSARIAKRFIDGKNFFGGLLHAFYAPELESVSETRNKLIQRRKDVTFRIKSHKEDPTNPEVDPFVPKEQYQRKKKTPALPLTEERLAKNYPGETLTTIYNGIPQNIDPRPVSEPSLPESTCHVTEIQPNPAQELLRGPYLSNDVLFRSAGVRESKIISKESPFNKRKNYKGQSANKTTKVRIVRPQIIDTRNIAKKDKSDKTVFTNVKQVDSGIIIKLLPKEGDEKKRIVIKDSSTTQLVQSSNDLKNSIESAKSQIRSLMMKNT
ncbi:RNA-binding protein 48 [Orussus abietinus]|uniref:RNA-binding protein 48 n=1 Tax=Orussus abietinus TaxID=222816 RepID=UPI0006262ADC|nr:RNA-binding protein 48 [Orussus abietinus]